MAVQSNGANRPAAYVDRRLAGAGAALASGGLIVGMAGATMLLVATVKACRGYVADLQEPPVVMARRRFHQAKSATMAGVGAWQKYDG